MSLSRTVRTLGCLLAAGAVCLADEAKPFYIPLDGANDIVFNQDHLAVTLLHGWISSKDSFFKALLSSKSKLVVGIDGQVIYFDGDKSTYSKLLENTDISKNTDRPWGAVLTLIDNQPADAAPGLTFKLGINRDDRLSKLLDAVKTAEPADLTTQIDAYVAYGRLLSALLTNILGTNKTNYPFLLTADIKASSLVGNGKMKEHYLIGIAPNKDGDPFVPQVDATKLKYDEASQQLKYDNQVLTDHSYAVLKVTKGQPADITRLMAESKAPWAVLAVTQFLAVQTLGVTNKDQITVLAKNLLTQLTTELDLLKNEHRFSAYDRAVALYSFATRSKTAVTTACTSNSITGANCPTGDLDQFINNIKTAFNLPADVPVPAPLGPRIDFDKLLQQFNLR